MGLYSSEGEITPKKVGTIVHYISWMLNIFFYRLILYAYRVTVISNVSLWDSGSFVGGFESAFAVVVRVRINHSSFDVSNRLKMPNRCGTCFKRSATLQGTVDNHWQNHKEAVLCVARPIWDAENVYQMLNYNVRPETIPDASTLDVDDINWTITPPLPSGIGHTPQPKQQTLSGTPVRCTTAHKLSFDVPEQLNQTIGYEQDDQTDLLCDSLADMSLENRHLVQELISISLMLRKMWMLLGNFMTGIKPYK